MCSRILIIVCVAITLTIIPSIQGCDAKLAGTEAVRSPPFSSPGKIKVIGVPGAISRNHAKIQLDPASITVSSADSGDTSGSNLVSEGSDGYWRPRRGAGDVENWVTVDLGTPWPVSLIRVKPAKGRSQEIWRGGTARLATSNEGRYWGSEAVLSIEPWPPDEDWILFPVLLSQAQRYYRISIRDPGFGSLGRLEFYRSPISGNLLSRQQNTGDDRNGIVPLVMASESQGASDLVKLHLEAAQIRASSSLLPNNGPEKLFEEGTGSFWHLRLPREEDPAWVVIDLSSPYVVGALRLKPRDGFYGQIWDGNRAILYGSNDVNVWTPLAELAIDRTMLRDVWLTFLVPVQKPYRYIRISISDMRFVSLGGLRVYASVVSPEKTAGLPQGFSLPVAIGVQGLDPGSFELLKLQGSQISVSSVYEPGDDEEALITGNEDTFWHVKVPKEAGPSFVTVDLGREEPVGLARVRPRKGFTGQIWDGVGATLQGSADGRQWTSLAYLAVDRDFISDDWISFQLPNVSQNRYYRLLIDDPGFFALGKLQLYRATR